MRPVHYLGVFIPAAIALELAHASPLLVFSAAALGVIPCAAVMGEATEAIAAKSGPGIGGLLNVTFGNAPELIIAFFALLEGLQEVVKASIVGSIIGNVLLVMGAAFVVGGWSREKQTFSQTAASAQSAMLTLALAALIFPALFQLIHGGSLPGVGDEHVDFGSDLEKLSLGVALVLLRELRGRAVVLAEDAPRRLQPVRRRRAEEEAAPLAGQAGGDLPGALGGRRRRDERDPGGVDQRGVRGHRPVRVLRRRLHRGHRRATPPSTGSRCSWRPRTRWTSR